MRDRTGRRPSTVALILVTGTTALSTDAYISALPALRASLGTTASAAQLTLTACIAGMALGQILIGPISDARGRRPIILVATLAFAVMSVVCATATAAPLMIVARAVQGMACGAAAAVGRAMVSDTHVGRAAAAKFGTLTAVGLIAPVVGPVIGGGLVSIGSWRTVFWFLALVGVAMFVATLVGLPESLPVDGRHPGGMRALGIRTADLLRDRSFIVPVLVQCLTAGGFFIYIGGSSLVLQTDLGLSPGAYTAVFSVNAGTMITSSVVFRLLVLRTGAARIRRVAQGVQTVAVLALVVVAIAAAPAPPPLVLVWPCLALMTLGLGAYLPANSSITQAAGRRFAGTASALGGGLPFLVGSLTTPLTGLLGAETVFAMALGMGAFFAAAFVAAVAARRAARS